MIDKSKKYALSLEGGGFRGAYQAGAIYALYENGIKFSAVCGTSIGSLNGVFVAMKKIERLKEIWFKFSVGDVFSIENDQLEKLIKFDFSNINLADLGKGLLETTTEGGLDIEPFIDLIEQEVDEELVRNSDIAFGLATYNISDIKGEELMIEDMPPNTLKSYLLASSYLPVFQQKDLMGKRYFDGGIFNNMPTNMLTERGYEDIIQIRLHRNKITEKFPESVSIYTIASKEYLGPVLVINKENIVENFEKGYQAALDLINKK